MTAREILPDGPVRSADILAFDPNRKNNAQLIRDVAELGYLQKDWTTLDPTYGKGRFWRLWQPHPWNLHTSDTDPESDSMYAFDFTAMPWDDGKFDAVVFDPPYKLNGTGGSHASDEGYGVADEWGGVEGRHNLIFAGIEECVRVLKPKGILLVKCQDQVCSGNVVWQDRMIVSFVESSFDWKMTNIDKLFVHGGIPQPAGRRQVHARRNYSTALIFRKAK